MKKFIKKNRSTILVVMIFTVGLSLLLYPTFSDWWNSFHATRAIGQYDQQIANLSDEDYQHYFDEANQFNQNLKNAPNRFDMSEELKQQYNSSLNIDGNGLIGVLTIPSIKVKLPIYHGTEEGVLRNSVGHLEGTTLPIGGDGTHSVLSGHRGLPSAKLLSDLDDLETGDYFMIQVFEELFTYQVDQVLIVEPDDLSALAIEDGKDYVTLITCTPYGVNTHRLLVRGSRIDNLPEDYVDTRNDAKIVDRNLVAIASALIIALILIVFSTLKNKIKRHRI